MQPLYALLLRMFDSYAIPSLTYRLYRPKLFTKTRKDMAMNEHEMQDSGNNADSYLDAFAAVALILIAVATAVFWVSQH